MCPQAYQTGNAQEVGRETLFITYKLGLDFTGRMQKTQHGSPYSAMLVENLSAKGLPSPGRHHKLVLSSLPLCSFSIAA